MDNNTFKSHSRVLRTALITSAVIFGYIKAPQLFLNIALGLLGLYLALHVAQAVIPAKPGSRRAIVMDLIGIPAEHVATAVATTVALIALMVAPIIWIGALAYTAFVFYKSGEMAACQAAFNKAKHDWQVAGAAKPTEPMPDATDVQASEAPDPASGDAAGNGAGA